MTDGNGMGVAIQTHHTQFDDRVGNILLGHTEDEVLPVDGVESSSLNLTKSKIVYQQRYSGKVHLRYCIINLFKLYSDSECLLLVGKIIIVDSS